MPSAALWTTAEKKNRDVTKINSLWCLKMSDLISFQTDKICLISIHFSDGQPKIDTKIKFKVSMWTPHVLKGQIKDYHLPLAESSCCAEHSALLRLICGYSKLQNSNLPEIEKRNLTQLIHIIQRSCFFSFFANQKQRTLT